MQATGNTVRDGRSRTAHQVHHLTENGTMSGSMASTATEDFEVFAWGADDPFEARAMSGRATRMARVDDDKDPEDEPLDDDLDEDEDDDGEFGDDDLDEDDDLGDDEDEDADEDDLDEDDADLDDDEFEDLDDELIDLDDEYDATDDEDRPHPGHERFTE